jgi:hypothetical protein
VTGLLLGLLLVASPPDLALHLAPLDPELRAQVLQQPSQSPQAPAYNPDPNAWTGTDTALESLFGAAMLGDYLQTRRIQRAGREVNPIMGARGQRVPPELYFPATMGLHYLTMKALPASWRHAAQGLSLGFEGGVVGRNLGLGWGFRF